MKNPKILVCMIGTPYSGKTSWARSSGIVSLGADDVRLAIHGQAYIQEAEPIVWATYRFAMRSLFVAGNDTVIADNTNTSVERRSAWMPNGYWDKVLFTYIKCPKEVCLKRLSADDRPDKEAMVQVIERMSAQLKAEPPERILTKMAIDPSIHLVTIDGAKFCPNDDLNPEFYSEFDKSLALLRASRSI